LPIKRAELQPGDLVFFNTMGRPFSHVGLYIGNQQFVHAPSTGNVIRVESIHNSYWVRRFDSARRITAAEAHAVRHLVPLAARAARRLRGSAIPATVQHDDLQPSNVVGEGALIDWGDASVAHPFASLLTALSGSSGRPAAEYRSAIQDAYLSAFAGQPDGSLASGPDLDDLREQARLAVLLAPVGRIRAWLRVPGAVEEYPDAVTVWWRRILADPNWDRLR